MSFRTTNRINSGLTPYINMSPRETGNIHLYLAPRVVPKYPQKVNQTFLSPRTGEIYITEANVN
jgi:hypothetical protein